MDKVGHSILIQELFDLVVGTLTGIYTSSFSIPNTDNI
jgi:hypothetical protein